MKKLKILVTGASGDLGRSIGLYLTNLSYEIVVADTSSALLAVLDARARYVLPKANNKDYLTKLNRILKKEEIDFIFFGSDIEIRVASKNAAEIKTKIWLPKYETVRIMQDKYLCNKLWEKAGICVPKSKIVKVVEDLRGNSWLRPLGYIGGGAKLARYAKTKREAVQWVGEHTGFNQFTISEYLPGRLFGFDSLWKDGRLIGHFLKERLRYLNEGEELGFSTSVIKNSDNKLAIKTAIDAILAIDQIPDGVFTVDLRENTAGKPAVTEINPGRFLTTSLLFFLKTGYDLPNDYINMALGREITKRPPLKSTRYLFFVKGLVKLASNGEVRSVKI